MNNTERTTWKVVYRTGGIQNCQWRETLAFQTESEARECAERVERMGYKALVNTSRFWNAIGLPQGWEFSRA
jgi:hypothetical protein